MQCCAVLKVAWQFPAVAPQEPYKGRHHHVASALKVLHIDGSSKEQQHLGL